MWRHKMLMLANMAVMVTTFLGNSVEGLDIVSDKFQVSIISNKDFMKGAY